jgi:hypothetical protein
MRGQFVREWVSGTAPSEPLRPARYRTWIARRQGPPGKSWTLRLEE